LCKPEIALSEISRVVNMRFEILFGDAVVGHSDLELGDPPMGVAFGIFVPASGYSVIEADCKKSTLSSLNYIELSAREVGGLVLPASGGVCVFDYSDELGPSGREVSVLGIPYPLYQQLFPEHVAAYDKQFD
jgi:hypothetical protein